jgi:hypothetical protein
MTAPLFCHPEFGCDCDEEIARLEKLAADALEGCVHWKGLYLATKRVLKVLNSDDEHSKCGSTCTPECMKMTV